MEAALGRLARELAVDLGTANTLVYAHGRGVVLDEPSVVAVHRTSSGALGEVLAVGHAAQEMLGRTPGSIVALRPLKDGVISDFAVTEEMLRAFLKRATGGVGMVKPKVVVCVPSGLSEVEKRAVHESARSAGSREVQLISEPLAAAVGGGLPVMEPVGSMVVDIGGGTTEVAVISLGGPVKQTSLKVAGDAMNRAIARFCKERGQLEIGDRTAEAIKLEVGSARRLAEPLEMTIKGLDTKSGKPRQARVSSNDILRALEHPLGQIVEAIREVLEGTPPELAGDVMEHGILLCGGGALLRGLDQRLAEETGLPFHLAEEPLRCVVHGAGRALADSVLLERIRLS